MRRLLVLALPVLLTTTLACDSGGDEGGDDNSAIKDLTGDSARGQMVFTANACSSAGCHGADGNSGSAPALRDVVGGRSDDQLIDAVLDGKGSMPPQDLADQEMADVLAWMRASF